jgi:hypothetical protein
MGVEATLFVIAKYSRDCMYGDATIELNRDYTLWTKLNALPVRGHANSLQLMRGSWNADSDGKRVTPEDCEGGYLFGDSYNPEGGFNLYDVNDLGLSMAEGKNGDILNFVRQTYAGHRFLIIWH